MKLRKVVITIDAWKLEIFSRHLTQRGYAFKSTPLDEVGSCLLLGVETENLEALAAVTLAANTEAARTGAPS